MAVLVAALPADSATARALHGEAVRWTLTDHLLALVVDRLAVVSWQLGGNPKAPYPTPMVRPGVADQTVRYGRATRPRRQIVAYLRQFAPPKKDEEVTYG